MAPVQTLVSSPDYSRNTKIGHARRARKCPKCSPAASRNTPGRPRGNFHSGKTHSCETVVGEQRSQSHPGGTTFPRPGWDLLVAIAPQQQRRFHARHIAVVFCVILSTFSPRSPPPPQVNGPPVCNQLSRCVITASICVFSGPVCVCARRGVCTPHLFVSVYVAENLMVPGPHDSG